MVGEKKNSWNCNVSFQTTGRKKCYCNSPAVMYDSGSLVIFLNASYATARYLYIGPELYLVVPFLINLIASGPSLKSVSSILHCKALSFPEEGGQYNMCWHAVTGLVWLVLCGWLPGRAVWLCTWCRSAPLPTGMKRAGKKSVWWCFLFLWGLFFFFSSFPFMTCILWGSTEGAQCFALSFPRLNQCFSAIFECIVKCK